MSDENTESPELDPVDDAPVEDAPDNDDAPIDDDIGADDPPPAAAKSAADIRAEEAERRAEAAERRMRESESLISQRMTAQDRRAEETAERERVMNMSPEERMDYTAQQHERRLNYITQQAELRIQDANDRAEFAVFAAKNPAAAKYADEVEKRITDARNQGFNYSRKVMLTYIAGEKALASAEKGGSRKQKQQASDNKQKSQGKATLAGGDKRLNGRVAADDKAARNERLRGGKNNYN